MAFKFKSPVLIVLSLLQILLIVGMCLYAFQLFSQNVEFKRVIANNNPDYGTLILGIIAFIFGILLAYFRWYFILQNLGINCSLWDVVHAASTSDLIGAISLGTAGTDVSRGIFVFNKSPQQKTAITVSILLDRIIGLNSLILLGVMGLIIVPEFRDLLFSTDYHPLQILFYLLIIMCIGGFLVLFASLHVAGLTRLQNFLTRIPVIGEKLKKMTLIMDEHAQNYVLILKVIGLSLVVHLLMASGFYLLGTGLKQQIPPWSTFLTTHPLITLVGIIPLPLGGIGVGEVSMDYLYRAVANLFGKEISLGTGVIIGLMARICCLVIQSIISLLSMYFIHKKITSV